MRGTPVRQVVQLLERFQELLAAECFGREGVDHFFDFGRDHVAADEVGVVEDRVEQPDREQVLDQHFVDGRLAEVRVERLAAEVEEGIERLLELLVLFVGLFDLVFEAEGELGDALLEIFDGLLEAFDIGLDVAIEQVQQVAKLLGIADIEAGFDLFAVLVEDGRGCVFEDRVGKGIAEGDLLADFLVELVGGVFGFPVAVVEVELVAECAVGADLFAADAGGELRDEVPEWNGTRISLRHEVTS